MTALSLYDDTPPHSHCGTLRDFSAITEALAPHGVHLERWEAGASLPEDATEREVLAAYRADIERLKASNGYRSCDVIRVTPDHPDRAVLRARFLAEHVHDDDEVRFFVEGSGLFYIRAGGRIHALECTAGNLILLPAGTVHWFDTGPRPRFTAIRLFTTPDGWVARFTGDPIAEAIPCYEGAL